jgi:hypothetical protein
LNGASQGSRRKANPSGRLRRWRWRYCPASRRGDLTGHDALPRLALFVSVLADMVFLTVDGFQNALADPNELELTGAEVLLWRATAGQTYQRYSPARGGSGVRCRSSCGELE